MNQTNRHGLSRAIPEAIKRAVRQRDGFGCVVCGKAIFEYHHFDPDFASSTDHRVDGIALLCLEHHGKVTRRMLSSDTVRKAVASPAAKKAGFSHEAFDIGDNFPEVHIGSIRCRNIESLIEVRGERIHEILRPEAQGAPFRINATILNEIGDVVLRIVENEWQSSTENWDVKVVGQRITIRSAPRNVTLVIRSEPPNRLIFEKLNMIYQGVGVIAQEGLATALTNAGNTLVFGRVDVWDANVGIKFTENGFVFGEGGWNETTGMVYNPTRPHLLDSGLLVLPVMRSSDGSQNFVSMKMPRRNEACFCGSGKKCKRCHLP